MKMLNGIGVSKGMAIEKAELYENQEMEIKEEKDQVLVLKKGIEETKEEAGNPCERVTKGNSKKTESFEAHTLLA